MGSVSIWHWVVVGVIVLLLFGRGKISDMMGDVAKGIKAFKKGMADDETASPSATEPAKPIENQSVQTTQAKTTAPAGDRPS